MSTLSSMRRGALAAALCFSLSGAAPVAGWQKALPAGGALSVELTPVSISGGSLNGLEPAGSWVLRCAHPDFGGLSGLLVEGDRLRAVSDQGWWFGARFVEARGGQRLEDARLAPMRDPGGETYEKASGDAEGLTRAGATLAVSFERDHRVMLLRETGRLGDTIQARAFEKLPLNMGLEALATLPDGRLIALAEARDDDGNVPMFLIGPDGAVSEGRLRVADSHPVTGADVGPDGRLYLVLRDFSLLTGVSIRVVRYQLGPDGMPLADTAETLAAYEQGSGIDNMEGIAVSRGADGNTWLWLISDDNFNPLQRTLLIRFRVRD